MRTPGLISLRCALGKRQHYLGEPTISHFARASFHLPRRFISEASRPLFHRAYYCSAPAAYMIGPP